MTEQPVETEQQFLGNEPQVGRLYPSAAALLDCTGGYACTASRHLEGCLLGATKEKPLQHYAPNAHRLRWPNNEPEDPAQAAEQGPTDLQLEAEVHSGHALRSLENGELDAGIAWLQSALAFAQNARHSREFGILGAAL